jgi:hypothetical protein
MSGPLAAAVFIWPGMSVTTTEADDHEDHRHGDLDPTIAIQVSLLNAFQHSSKRSSTDPETFQL